MHRRKRGDGSAENGFEEWGGYMPAKKSKLQEQFENSAKKESSEESSGIFKGIAIFVNGYTVPSSNELKQLMMVHGGHYHYYMHPSHTTHIIATNLPDSKVRQLGSQKVVRPQWIVDSVKEGRLLDYKEYILYSSHPSGQTLLPFVKTSTDSLTSTAVEKDMNLNTGNEELKQFTTASSVANLIDSPHIPQETHSGVTQESPPRATVQNTKGSPGHGLNLRAGEPNFLSEFYSHSRLHYISTMGATFKSYVKELRTKSDKTFPSKERLRMWKQKQCKGDPEAMENYVTDDITSEEGSITLNQNTDSSVIMHIDMDCFFVSVGLRKHPQLRGLPVAVTHSKGSKAPPRSDGSSREQELNLYKKRLEEKVKKSQHHNTDEEFDLFPRLHGVDEFSSMAEIASCSYEAREMGLKNGMFVGAALKLCPDLRTIPYDFEGYKEVAYVLYDTVASYTLDIEAVSCDELYADITAVLKETGASPEELANFIRNEIKKRTGCPASAGLSQSRLLARLATRKAKPDGMFYLQSSAVEEYMKKLSVQDLPGIGRTLGYRLSSLSISSCEDLQKLSLSRLQQEFGQRTGLSLYKHCRGEDDKIQLSVDHQRRSVSAEVNYGIRFTGQSEAEQFLTQLSGEVESRLKEAGVKGRSVTLKLKVRAKEAPVETAKFMGHGVCDNIARSSTLPMATSEAAIIARETLRLFRLLHTEASDLRGVGIQVSRLESTESAGQEHGKRQVGLELFLKKNESCSKHSDTADKSLQEKDVPLNYYSRLPSHSQLDQEVLAALPKDVRDEILREYQNEQSATTMLCSPQPGPSRSRAGREELCGDSVADSPFDQIDPSFLAALPDDLRQEVQAQIQEQKTGHDKQGPGYPTTTGDPVSPTRSLKRSPVKSANEGKGIKGLKRRGRPPKSVGVPVGQETLIDYKIAKVTEKEVPCPVSLTTQNKSDETFEQPTIKYPKREEKVPVKVPTLCGESSLDGVRAMIREWVASTDSPQVCDGEIVTNYLCDLVLCRQLEELLILLRCFQRTITKLDSSMWQTVFEETVNQVQKVMKATYHAELKIDTDYVPP